MSLQKSLTLSLAAGRSVFTGKLASTKNALSTEVEMITRLYSRDGGVVRVCKTAVAHGASFSRNQHPKLGIQVPE